MTKRASTNSSRAASSLVQGLLLAPSVVAMRLPLLAAEAQAGAAWPVETVGVVTEKVAAIAEGAVAAQLSLAVSVSRYWLELFSGKTPSIFNGVALQRAVHAAMEPSAKRVRANHGRLSRSKG